MGCLAYWEIKGRFLKSMLGYSSRLVLCCVGFGFCWGGQLSFAPVGVVRSACRLPLQRASQQSAVVRLEQSYAWATQLLYF